MAGPKGNTGLGPAKKDADKKFGNKPAAAPTDPCPGDVPVTIELQMAYALASDRFRKTDVSWPDVPYDPDALINELYPTPKLKTWRLAGPHGKPIVGATLRVVGAATTKDAAPTDAQGKATFVLKCPAGGAPFVAVRVTPPPGQESPTGRAAGPALTDENTTAPFLFRPFIITFALDATGALLTDETDVLFNKRLVFDFEAPRDPAYARIIESTKRTKSANNLIVVDWRADWMLSGTKKRAKSRRYDKRDVPINPFDNAHGRQGRLDRAPPTVVIHETATPNLPVLNDLFTNANPDISIHYVVDYDGFVIKGLDEFYRANHARGSAWEQRVAANDFSVGIEVMHTDTTPFAQATGAPVPPFTPRRFTREQYEALSRLLGELFAEYPVLQRRVVGHMEVVITSTTHVSADSDKVDNFVEETGSPVDILNGTISGGRAECPGTFFEWQRLEEAGVALPLVALPTQPPRDPALAAVVVALGALANVTLINKNGPEAKLVKQLLFDIGYSVIKTPPRYTDRSDLPTIRAAITEEFDAPLIAAVRAFQTHHFSGRRRKYTMRGATPAGGTAAGTLDRDTIVAIQQKWFAAMTDT
jgi:N-acetyl-anhydromuramyl-L-alanine amidase AmpD